MSKKDKIIKDLQDFIMILLEAKSNNKHAVSVMLDQLDISALANNALADAIPSNTNLWVHNSRDREYYKIVWSRGFKAAIQMVKNYETAI